MNIKDNNMELSNPKIGFSKLRIIKNLVVISVAFLLISTACDGLSMLQTTMNKEEGVGTVGQAVIHVTDGISALLLSSFVVKQLGTKNTQLLGMIMYLPYVTANFYPSWITLVPSAVIIGMGCTLMWAAQCTYFNESSVIYRDLIDAFKHTNSYPSQVNPGIACVSNHQSLQLSALDVQKAIKGPNSREDETLPPLSLPSYKFVDVHCIEANQRKRKKSFRETKEFPPVFKELDSKTCNNVKLSESFEDIKTKANSVSELHSVNNFQHERNQNSKSSLSSVNALFFGIHGLAYCSAQIWSNLISFYVLKSGEVQSSNKTSNCSCGASFCNTDHECVNSKIEEVPADIRYYYTGICVACGILAVLLIWLFVDSMDKSKDRVTLSWNHIFDTMKYIKNYEQFCTIPLTISAGMIQAFYMADFTKSYIACSWSTSHIGLVAVFYGATSALSSIISGLLIKLFGRKIILTLCQIVNMVCLALLYLWIPDPQHTYMVYLASGTFGFIVGIFHTQTKALYGIFFGGDEETAFSSCNLYSSIGWVLPFVYGEILCTSVKIWIMFIVACLGLVGYLLAERSFNQRNKQTYLLK